MIKGVHSAVIWTEDMGRLLGFYRDTVGLKPEMETPEFVVFAGQPAQLCIGKHSEVKGPSRDPYRTMVDLTVDDCKAEYERLKGKGVEFIREPGRDNDDGITLATFKDPDGNVLQLFELPG